MEAAKAVIEKSNGTMSLWAVGQAFNWGAYEKDRKRYETQYRYPTEHEYIAMALLPPSTEPKGISSTATRNSAMSSAPWMKPKK